MRRLLPSALTVLVMAACRDTAVPVGPSTLAPDLSRSAPMQSRRYIVVFKPSVTSALAEIRRHVPAGRAGGEHLYQHALRGWAGDLSPAELVRMKADPTVAYIENDARLTINGTQTPTPSWGLDRIDQHPLPLNSAYGYARTGAGVHFYGIDTGILYTHSDFGGRAVAGFDAVTPGGAAVDCHGHGTHTASTAAGSTYGVAKAMAIVGVRVMDCAGGGWTSDVIAGVDWVTRNAIRPAVANMSLGGGISSALDQAVAGSIASGVVYSIASGNSNADACNSSPARVPQALTVNASGSNDARASFSNFGSCTDIFAPGVNITAAWIGSNTATRLAGGTSMAAPHVAGVAGLYLEANRTATAAQVAAALLGNSTANLITGAGTGSPNKLLYMGFIGSVPVNQPPSAAISLPIGGLSAVQGASISFAGTGTDAEDGTLTGASLVWTSSRDGQIGTGTTFAKTNLTVGTHTITLKATDSQLATGTASRSITVTAVVVGNQPPVARFTWSCATGKPYQCQVDATSSTDDVGIVRYTWNWGDGRSESSTTPLRLNTWASAGTYNVTLQVTDAAGLSSSVTKPVLVPTTTAVNQPPSAAISLPVGGTSFVQGTSVSFAGTGTDPEDGALSGASLVWTSSRDGQIGTGTTFAKTNLTVGTHTITLTATDSKLATGTASRSITVTALVVGNQPPVARFTWSCATGQPHQCQLDATSSTDDVGIVLYAWNWGNGRSESRSTPLVLNTWASAGTFNVTLTVTDGAGLTGSVTKAVVVP